MCSARIRASRIKPRVVFIGGFLPDQRVLEVLHMASREWLFGVLFGYISVLVYMPRAIVSTGAAGRQERRHDRKLEKEKQVVGEFSVRRLQNLKI